MSGAEVVVRQVEGGVGVDDEEGLNDVAHKARKVKVTLATFAVEFGELYSKHVRLATSY